MTLDKRAKAYWPGTGRGDSTIIYSGFTTAAQAEAILDRLIAAGCTGGHIEHHVQGIGWVMDVTQEDPEPIPPHAYR